MASLSLESVARDIAALAASAMGKDPASIQWGASLDSQGVDSLGLAEVVYEVQDMFGVQLPESDAAKKRLRSINDLAAYVVAQKSVTAA